VSEQAQPAPPSALAEAEEVNRTWPAEPAASSGWRGLLLRQLERLLQPRLEAQRTFNAAQVRFDNVLLQQMELRLSATQRHYDTLLGAMGRRQDEADQRHQLLERELLAHVRDLVERIDVVLLETNRDRHALQHALEDLRDRLARLEQRLGGQAG
jgi:hypothetical protein